MLRDQRARIDKDSSERIWIMRCYHVTTSDGQVIDVSATTERDALSFVAERLFMGGDPAEPVKAEFVGSCQWTYGTTLKEERS